MALRQLIVKKRLENTRSELTSLLEVKEQLDVRMQELRDALEEVEEGDVENLELVESEVDELEPEMEENKKNIETLEETIRQLEKELEDIDEPETKEEPEQKQRSRNLYTGGTGNMDIRQRVAIPEVRGFYSQLTDVIRNKRSIEGGELTVPVQVIDAIRPQIREFSKYYDKVDVIRLTGDARIVVPGTTPTGIWLECCDPLEELKLSLNVIDLDCYKVGGYVSVCNAMLEDSYIDLAAYVEREIAKSIGKAIDDKFITGKPSEKSITGLLNSELPVVETNFDLAKLMGALAQAEDNDDFIDNSYTDVRYLIMNPGDYYNKVANQLLIPQVDGKYLIESFKGKILPDGTRVIPDSNVPAGTAFFGDLKGYKLGERKGVTLTRSEHAQFIQDNTVFKGVGRYDGKVAAPTIVKLTITDGGSAGE